MPIDPPPGLAPQHNRLAFGPVLIEWDRYVDQPMQVDHVFLNGECAFITGCDVTFRRGPLCVTVPRGFRFDGATIPRWFWIIPGFAPVGVHLWAALCHDWLCVLAVQKPDEMDRDLADAVFASLLKVTNVGWRGVAMDLAVSAYRRWTSLRGLLKPTTPMKAEA